MSGSIQIRVAAVNVGRALQKADLMETAAVTAISQAVVRDSEPYVPKREGKLRASAETESDYETGKVRYGSAAVPYAAPQYNAPGGWKYTTPGTGPDWYSKADGKHLKQWIKEGEQAAKEEASK